MLLITFLLYMLASLAFIGWLVQRHTTSETLLLHDYNELNSKMLDQISSKDDEINLANETLDITRKLLAAAIETNEKLELQLSKALELNVQMSDELDKLQSRELPQLHEMQALREAKGAR